MLAVCKIKCLPNALPGRISLLTCAKLNINIFFFNPNLWKEWICFFVFIMNKIDHNELHSSFNNFQKKNCGKEIIHNEHKPILRKFNFHIKIYYFLCLNNEIKYFFYLTSSIRPYNFLYNLILFTKNKHYQTKLYWSIERRNMFHITVKVNVRYLNTHVALWTDISVFDIFRNLFFFYRFGNERRKKNKIKCSSWRLIGAFSIHIELRKHLVKVFSFACFIHF